VVYIILTDKKLNSALSAFDKFDYIFPNSKLYCQHVGFEVLTAVVVKNSVFCDVILGGPLKNRLTCRMNMSPPSSGRRLSEARNQHEACRKQSNLLAKCSGLNKK
jgi:hypothetical protein